MDSTLAISLIVTGLIKPIILLLVIVFLWLCVRKKSAALQHFVLSLGVIALLLLPFLASIVPAVEERSVPILADIIRAPQQWLNALMPLIINSLGKQELMITVGVYLLPATWLLFYTLLGVFGLSRIAARAQSVECDAIRAQINALRELLDITRPVKVMTSREVNSPQTWGVWHPVIMLPREALLWDEEKQLSVFIHELGHIARWDWLMTLWVKITCACFWFLLPVWWLAQKIYQQAEIACDDYIYKLRDKHIAYAQNLLAIAGTDSHPNAKNDALCMRGHSPIYQRIMLVLDKQRPHLPVPIEAAQYWLIVGGLFLVLFASVQIIPLQEQLRERVEHLLRVDFPQQGVLGDAPTAVYTEQFSWELLQQLKPQDHSAPAQIDNVEQVSIHVARPTKQEFQDLQELNNAAEFYQQAIAVPSIHIQGYLPIDMAKPEYPTQALAKGIEGWVEVTFSIDTQGNIINPQISAHSPSRIFDRSVLAALKKSRYRPLLLDGQPVVVQGVTELFRFNLITSSKQADSDDSLSVNHLDHRRR